MARTQRQVHGELAEKLVCKHCSCPKCKKPRKIAKLRVLPKSFECADVICNFCGFLAQVKRTEEGRDRLPGGGWKVQKLKLDAGIFHPLYVVTFKKDKFLRINYLPADFMKRSIFVPRTITIKSGRPKDRPRLHRMFDYDLSDLESNVSVQVWPATRANRLTPCASNPATLIKNAKAHLVEHS